MGFSNHAQPFGVSDSPVPTLCRLLALADTHRIENGFLEEGLADASLHFHEEVLFQRDLGQVDPFRFPQSRVAKEKPSDGIRFFHRIMQEFEGSGPAL